ncbi:MAG: DUF4199 domain-containing protein [Thermoanaerobaculia bacterium]
MKKTVWTWGLISGAVSTVMMVAMLPFVDSIGFDKGEIIGYTSLVLSALLIFFGIRSYRENVGGGKLGFGRGLAVGLLIALVASACYVATWEVIYFKFMPDFADKYSAHMAEKAKASGATPEKLERMKKEAADFKKLYDNPVINAGFTFLEPFPFGLAASLLSAAILRKK